MKGYLSQIRMTLRLSLRDGTVVFFNYIFPLMFFFLFGQMFHAQQGAITQVVAIVLTIGVLGTGLMGAGLRAAADREANILRRFIVAPISAAPIMASSLVVGLFQYLFQAAIVLFLARTIYKMPPLEHPVSLMVFLSLGALAFRAIGQQGATYDPTLAVAEALTAFVQGSTAPHRPLAGAAIRAAGIARFHPNGDGVAGIERYARRVGGIPRGSGNREEEFARSGPRRRHVGDRHGRG
jgi:ABC-2 type transport system permease protein